MNTIKGMIEDLRRDETHIGGCTTKGELIIALESLERNDKYSKEIDHLHKYIAKLETRIVEQDSVLDEIRAEIKTKIEEEEFARSVFRHEEKDKAKAEQCTGSIMAYNNMIKLIDKYKVESEEEE